jgi:large subunit ribosomal protein L33
MAKRKNRILVTLECTECHSQNYITDKSRLNSQGKMELKKYCPKERKVTLHREIK